MQFSSFSFFLPMLKVVQLIGTKMHCYNKTIVSHFRVGDSCGAFSRHTFMENGKFHYDGRMHYLNALIIFN